MMMEPSSHSILVVDDEADVRNLLGEALRKIGYDVISARCGSEALELMDRKTVCLVIADIRMPQMSGMELLTRIKQTHTATPVILLTGYASVQNAVEAMQLGAADYLMKPFTIETLQSVVDRAVENGSAERAEKSAETAESRREDSHRIITRNEAFSAMLETAARVAKSRAAVLIQGESGTGKELLARFIHRRSRVNGQPYVAVNCAALPDMLAESELFGHEKGSFTGAVSRKKGKFELARSGTIVLDEISEMSLPLQAKLLRVLQEKEIDRIGGTQPVGINCRVIAISNVDLKMAVREEKFRQDLFFRINVVPLTIPPLRERRDDIPVLAQYFCDKFCEANGRDRMKLPDETIRALSQYQWPGNVRELENNLERAVLVGSNERIEPEDLSLNLTEPVPQPAVEQEIRAGLSVREVEKKLIVTTLKQVNDNRAQAAEMLGISIRTLRNKLKEYRQAAQPVTAE